MDNSLEWEMTSAISYTQNSAAHPKLVRFLSRVSIHLRMNAGGSKRLQLSCVAWYRKNFGFGVMGLKPHSNTGEHTSSGERRKILQKGGMNSRFSVGEVCAANKDFNR